MGKITAFAGLLISSCLLNLGCRMDPSFTQMNDNLGPAYNCQAIGICDGTKPPIVPVFPGEPEAPDGLFNGHFDLDTAHLVYPLGAGATDHHVHEYDKVYQTTVIDFFNLKDSKFKQINQGVPSATSRFVLVVSNAELSPGAVLEINGQAIKALDYQNKIRELISKGAALPSYTLGVSAADTQLKSFRIGFSQDILNQGGLVPTQTGCVRKNNAGKKGEYRNGSLLVQALSASAYKIDTATHSAAQAGGGLFWESTVFWHKDDGLCY